MVNRHAEILILSARSAGKPEGGSSWCSSRVCTAHSIPNPGLCYGLTKAGESTAALTTPSWKGILGFTTTVRLTVQGDPPPPFLSHLLALILCPHFRLIALGSV